MKEITYNYDDVNENEINRIVRRAKVLIVNSNNEIMFAHSNKNYFLIGGHVDNDESDFECLEREIKEELGLDVNIEPSLPFIRIKYLNRDYPSEGVNTMSLANYYILKKDLVPKVSKTKLTNEEKEGEFHTVNINVYEAIDKLISSMDDSTRKGAVLDTIEAVKEYINITN